MAAHEYVDAFRKYQRTRGLSRATIERRSGTLKQFAASITPLPLLDATGELIEEWIGTYRSAATRRAYRSDLMAFYTWATKRDLCAANPVLRTDPIKVPTTLPRPVPPAYLPAVLAAAPPDVRMMIALAAYAGLRCAEIASLDASDIDTSSEAPVLAVRSGKGNKDRIVPIHPDLARMLRGIRPGPVVGVTAQTVGFKVAGHLRSLGIDATAHKLRHTFGTELARATEGNVVLVASLMGHGDVSTSMRYIGWAGGPGAAAVAAMYPSAA
jgi:integrase/recombinase XerC